MGESPIIKRQWFITSKVSEISESYQIGSEIGAGGYGKVYLAEDRHTHAFRAIKVLKKSNIKDYNTFVTELSILKGLDHPNIVNIIETYETESDCYVVLEHCGGGELFEKLIKHKRLSEQYAAKIMKSMLSAIIYCHSHNICHRDLKPENCLFIDTDVNSDLKIIDFGLATATTESEVLHDMYGTPYYLAPEILMGNYTKAVDCWSLGVILYMLLSGTPPFNGKNNNEVLMNVYSGEFSFRHRVFKNISNYAKDLIVRLLTKDPSYRITAKDAFMHPWIQELTPTPTAYFSESMISSLQQFSRSNTLKQASWSYIASKIDYDHIKKLRDLFKYIDINGDGIISKEEFINNVQRTTALSKLDIEAICLAMDTNKNGEIDYNEFLASCLNRKSAQNEDWYRSAFEYFDQDTDGFITFTDLKETLTGRGSVHLNIPRLYEIIKDADNNNDGKIDYFEFVRLIAPDILQ